MQALSPFRQKQQPVAGLSPCEHRTVSKDGRIICARIVDGENTVAPEICRSCPVKAVNCGHLRFALRQTSPSPLIVRFNGRTEVWDDDPPEIQFEQAACAARVMPIEHARVCAGCTLRQPVQGGQMAPGCQVGMVGAEQPRRRQRRAAAAGKVVVFPGREPVAATG
jgi:hypothetical protein